MLLSLMLLRDFSVFPDPVVHDLKPQNEQHRDDDFSDEPPDKTARFPADPAAKTVSKAVFYSIKKIIHI